MREAATAILILVVLAVALTPPLVDLAALMVRRVAWILRVHAHATRHYGRAFGRQYRRAHALQEAAK